MKGSITMKKGGFIFAQCSAWRLRDKVVACTGPNRDPLDREIGANSSFCDGRSQRERVAFWLGQTRHTSICWQAVRPKLLKKLVPCRLAPISTVQKAHRTGNLDPEYETMTFASALQKKRRRRETYLIEMPFVV
jgi:hypothetical protein